MYNIRGWWEWENGTVYVTQLSSFYHGVCVGAIFQEFVTATRDVMHTDVDILGLGATSE